MKNIETRLKFIQDYNSFIAKLHEDAKAKPFDNLETAKFFLTVSTACVELLEKG